MERYGDCLQNIKWFGYLSATSVYGDYSGNWVNEESETKPIEIRGEKRLRSEKKWLNSKLPVHIFRLAGIYGPGRNVLIDLQLGKAKNVKKEGHFFSRIHVEDISNILFSSMQSIKPGEIYNCADDSPTTQSEVIMYAAKLLNVSPPEPIELPDYAQSFYLGSKKLLHKSDFPTLPSYDRFIALKPRVLWYLATLLQWLCERAKGTGISYIDSTPIAICHRKRISKNKVFAGIATLSKSTYGWFFGLKLHMVINEIGEIQGVKANVDDRKPVPDLTRKLVGLLFEDKGYIKKDLFLKLLNRNLKLVTKIKRGMRNALISLNEKIFLRKRSIIETVFGYLKNRLEVEHTRHRSPVNFLVHIFSTLISYSLKRKKPSISSSFFIG
ncbi:NAD(P)-dependent oxidoreductase [Trichonephila inaurata madagascariensis]|uniref:NAD(P)-dependent oxidoreductase n=1 Tax=Trichonephila inaurata madagascariensis TaxID=2747483 RepID=A0A8X7CG77_9ARAC|nr:NAD(P)-dependent oxidoreductase [Trichonephila inaurata madagascariensis]